MQSLVIHLITITFLLSGAYRAQAQSSVGPNFARIQGIIINAKSFSRDSDTDIVELDGDVKIVFQNQQLSADRAKINLRSKSVDAVGNVTVITEKATIGGQRVILDYETETGVIFDGYVQSGQVIFEGNLIKKTSATDYISDNAKYTTCTTCPEAWSFSGQSIRAELGGYAYIKNSLLRFGGVPVFWLPYLIVPLKSDRQSGLLTPGFEQSGSGGLAIAQSFYWVMSRSQDSTWTIKNYERRGPKGLMNYRYVLNETSSGELDMGYLQDKVFANENRLNVFRPPQNRGALVNRWFLRYDHYYELPEGFVHRANLANASDLQYNKDFPEELQILDGDPAMESRTSLTKNTLNQQFMIDTSYYKNLLQSDPLSGNNFSVHRLPELKFSQTQTKMGESEFLWSLDLNYVNFARSNFAYDDLNVAPDPNNPNNDRYLQPGGSIPQCSTKDWEKFPECYAQRDGSYNPEKDLIRTGQRFDFKPTLYRPFKIGYLDILPKLTYRATQYTFPVGEDRTNTRQYLRAQIAARTQFSRVYGDLSSPKSERMKHEIQPELTLTSIPWLYHPKHPFFGLSQESDSPFFGGENVSDSDLNGPYNLQFDYDDRVSDRKLVTFSLTNKFTDKRWIGESPTYRQFLTWRLAQSYDAYQAERFSEQAQPWSNLLSELRVNLDQIEVYQRASYFPYQRASNTSTRVRLIDRKQDYVELWQILSFNVTPGQSEVDRSTRTETYTLTLKKGLRYLDFIGKATYDANPGEGKSYIASWGYGAQLKLPGDCWYINLNQYQVTGGDPKFKFNFGFIWDGETKPALPDNLGF
jgi:LPS-assembly protein